MILSTVRAVSVNFGFISWRLEVTSMTFCTEAGFAANCRKIIVILRTWMNRKLTGVILFRCRFKKEKISGLSA